LRRRYRELLRAEIAQTLADPAQAEEELRALMSAFCRGLNTRVLTNALSLDVPNFQNANNGESPWAGATCLGGLQLGYAGDGLRQTVKGDAGIQMMNVMNSRYSP